MALLDEDKPQALLLNNINTHPPAPQISKVPQSYYIQEVIL